MCGIFSYLHKSNIIKAGGLQLRQKIVNEFSKIQHRGPDNSVVENLNNKLIFGFHRLAIIDKSRLGNQPFILNHKGKKIYLICNGEIYNFKELKMKYNLTTISDSDCEVILHLYAKFRDEDLKNYKSNDGSDSEGIEEYNQETMTECIQNTVFRLANMLDGVFAFQIYDEQFNTLSVGRDPIGVRSLYYGYNNDSMCFSSEMKSIDKLATNIEFFPPGNVVSFNIDDTHYSFKQNLIKNTKRYYYYNYQYKTPVNVKPNDYEAFCELNICNLLTNAVIKRMMSDRPIGCLLSGGLDSSLIAALLAKELKKQNKRLHTFSIGFKNATDLKYAKMVADHIDSIHHEVIVTEQQMLDAVEDVIYKIESWDTTTIRASTPMILLCEYIKKNTDIAVIYSGEGSDEASGSYMYFHNAPDEDSFHNETCRLVEDLQYYDVLRSDKSISCAGLEARVPFLDKDFLEFYMSIHPSLKTSSKNKIEKHLLRSSFSYPKRELLPKQVLWRVKEAFSDGCSTKEKSWYTILQNHIETVIFPKIYKNDLDIEKDFEKYNSHQPPRFNEALYYRNKFEEYYPNRSQIIPYYWIPKWSGNVVEPSARVLDVYQSNIEKN